MEQDRGPSNSLIVCIVYSLLFSNHSQSCSQVALAFYSLCWYGCMFYCCALWEAWGVVIVQCIMGSHLSY